MLLLMHQEWSLLTDNKKIACKFRITSFFKYIKFFVYLKKLVKWKNWRIKYENTILSCNFYNMPGGAAGIYFLAPPFFMPAPGRGGCPPPPIAGEKGSGAPKPRSRFITPCRRRRRRLSRPSRNRPSRNRRMSRRMSRSRSRNRRMSRPSPSRRMN